METNPVTGEDERKEIEVTTDELIARAQKGHRFEDKMAKLNTFIDKRSQERAQEMIEPEVQKRIEELKSQILTEPKKDENASDFGDDAFVDESDKKMLNILTKIDNRMTELEKRELKREETNRERQKMAAEYDKAWNKIQVEYPSVDKETLAAFVKESKATPELLLPVARLIDSLKKKDIDVDELDVKSKRKLAEGLKKKLEAPLTVIEGEDSQHTDNEVPTTREGILDASLAMLDNMDFTEE